MRCCCCGWRWLFSLSCGFSWVELFCPCVPTAIYRSSSLLHMLLCPSGSVRSSQFPPMFHIALPFHLSILGSIYSLSRCQNHNILYRISLTARISAPSFPTSHSHPLIHQSTMPPTTTAASTTPHPLPTSPSASQSSSPHRLSSCFPLPLSPAIQLLHPAPAPSHPPGIHSPYFGRASPALHDPYCYQGTLPSTGCLLYAVGDGFTSSSSNPCAAGSRARRRVEYQTLGPC